MQLKRKKFIEEKLPPKHCELNYWFHLNTFLYFSQRLLKPVNEN